MKTFRTRSAEKTSRGPRGRVAGTAFMAFAAVAIFSASRQGAHAAASLYDEMLNVTHRELFLNDKSVFAPEPAILEPIEKWLPYVKNPNPGNTDEMDDLLDGGFGICERDNLDIASECEGARIAARQMVAREERTRTLGRDLQIIASGFEEPASPCRSCRESTASPACGGRTSPCRQKTMARCRNRECHVSAWRIFRKIRGLKARSALSAMRLQRWMGMMKYPPP
ncbi:hypothetical protein HYW84_01580 [Candidatus Peregrinibacteria bacterium]|nr:hypothetical protein [Candidatus Peregrinibacteria bacterium]